MGSTSRCARRSTSCIWASRRRTTQRCRTSRCGRPSPTRSTGSSWSTSQLPEGAEVASIFYPDTLDGWTDDVEKYAYDPQKAKDLLAEAGHSDLTLNFWWPTEVTRPYMPSPKDIFSAFKTDLEAVGITVNEAPSHGPAVTSTAPPAEQADIYLLGWTGDYNTPDNFIGTFFRTDRQRVRHQLAAVGRETGSRSCGR